MFSLAFILFLLTAWIFFKLGIGIVKLLAYLFIFGIIAMFFAYLLLPLLGLVFVGGLLYAILR